MSDNTKYPYPVILSMFNHTKCLYTDVQRVAQVYCLLQDMDNIQNTANPLSDISMHNIQSTANLSRHCIEFAPTRVHHDTRSLYPLDSSSKTSLAFFIASECYVPLWSDEQSLYIVMEMSRMLQN